MKIKVLVNGHDQKFWRPIQQQLEATGLYEFKEDFWPGHNQHNEEESRKLLSWADVILSEWALGNAVFYSKNKLPHQKLVVRFHAQELRTEYPANIDYAAVSTVIFVGPHVMREAIEKFGIPQEKARLVYNFVDCNRFDLKKMGGEEFNLGMIGIVPENKRIDRALDLLEALLAYDERYMLHIKGPQPFSYPWLWARTKEREYYQAIYNRINSSDLLRYKVVFDPAGNDIEHWLKKIGFILSPSNAESFHMALAEGMASGCVPVTWRREGVGEIFQSNILFDDEASAAKFIDITRKSCTRALLGQQSKDYIRNNFDRATTVEAWRNLISPDAKEVMPATAASGFNSVVIVWAIDAWSTFHRKEMLEALAKNLPDTTALLIIEPGTHYKTLLDKGICPEDELRQFADLKPIKAAESIFRLRILTSGFPEGVSVSQVLKAAKGDYAGATKNAVKALFGDRATILHWIYKPDQAKWAVDNQPFIYEVYDEYTMDFSTGAIHPEVARLEPEVLKKANHVFFTSQPLADRKKQHCMSWGIVGNGVDVQAFSRFSLNNIEGTGRKSVGYLGNLSDFFDWPTMVEVCERLPDIDFFFHGQVEHHRLGPVKGSVERLMALPNTFFTGRVTRPVGAAAVNRYDALIIPFVVNEAMHAVNPLKLWEYFAAGKPVISSPMDAIPVSAPLIRFATSPDEWVMLICEETSSLQKFTADRVELSKRHSWASLTKSHAEAIEASFT
jgi:glycosyltransferase involved in cell wall biosynthesis